MNSIPFLSDLTRKAVQAAYKPTADGPFVGKSCGYRECREYGRFILTPVGTDPAVMGSQRCARHMPASITEMMDTDGKAVVVQEVPKVTRYRKS